MKELGLERQLWKRKVCAGVSGESAVVEMKTKAEARDRKGSTKRNWGRPAATEQKGSCRAHSYVKVLTQGGKGNGRVKRQKGQEKAKKREGLLDVRRKGEEKGASKK